MAETLREVRERKGVKKGAVAEACLLYTSSVFTGR